MRERREVGEESAREWKQRGGGKGLLEVQVQRMEYEEVPEGAGRGEWNRKQERGLDL